MTIKTSYIANDRKEFESAAACQAHEKECELARLRERQMKSCIASDYAGLKVPNGAELYYGYEVTKGKEDEEEWCFRVRWVEGGNKREVIIPFSELGASDQFDVCACLLEGIAKLFESGAIAFTE